MLDSFSFGILVVGLAGWGLTRVVLCVDGLVDMAVSVAVTTQELLDGIREKAMRIPSLDEMGASNSAGRWSSSGGAENDRNKNVNEIVRALVGSITEEGDIVVACDSKSKLWKDVDLKRAMQNWNMKYVDISRSPESALRVIHQQLTTGKSHEDREIGKVGTFVQRTEMDAPRIGKLVKKSEMGYRKS